MVASCGTNILASILIGDRVTLSDVIFHFRVETYSYTLQFYKFSPVRRGGGGGGVGKMTELFFKCKKPDSLE